MPIPLRSDRSAWDTVGYVNLHARDLENNLPTVHLPAVLANQVALWDGSKWVGVPFEVSELLDVDMTGVQDGHVPIYDLVSGKWLTGPMTGGSGGGGGGGGDPVWAIKGRLAVRAGAGWPILIPRSCTLDYVYVYLKTAGSSGATVIDVNRNGSSILSAPISLPFNDVDHIVRVAPAVTSLSENNILTLDIDAIAPGAADLVVLLALHVETSGGGGTSLRVAEEGTLLPARSSINFIGGLVTAADDSANDRINVTVATPAPTPQTITVQNEGSQLTARGKINFIGALVNAVDDAANDRVNVTVSDPVIPTVTQQAIFTVESNVEVKAGTLKIVNHTGSTKTISAVYLDIGTSPAGSALIVDINNNGVSIFTSGNRPQIAAGASAGSSTTIATASWANNQALTMDVDQIGSGTAGADLTVTIVYS